MDALLDPNNILRCSEFNSVCLLGDMVYYSVSESTIERAFSQLMNLVGIS